MASSGFDDLLHQAQQLTVEMEVCPELPRVERTLVQIKDAANKMAYKSLSIFGDATDVKASLLLGSRGYEVTKIPQKLESLSRARTFEPLEPIRDVDIQAFLRNEHENAMLAAAERTRNLTFEEASQLYMNSLEREWEKEKQNILNSLIEMGDASFEFQYSQQNIPSSEQSFLGFEERLIDASSGYDDIIVQYNDSVINGKLDGQLSSMFVDLSKKLNDQVHLDIWLMVHTLVQACVPLRSVSSVRNSSQYQLAFITGAISYLQKSFLRYVEKIVACNLKEAHRGGIPGTYNLLCSYLNIKHHLSPNEAEDGMIDGHPLWALIYFCIRSGDNEAISEVVEKSRKIIGDFSSIISEYSLHKKLSVKSERLVKLQYKRNVSTTVDPYKRLVYCLMGRCDPQDDHPQVSVTTDDYLWLKLSQLVVESEFEAPEQMTLSKFQHLLDDFGETHFGAHQKPLLYFKILMMSGQFETAIEFLSRFESHKTIAVHVAIVLYESQLLLLPHNPHVQLLVREESDPLGRRLNFARLITTFARKFELEDPLKAINYYYFLRNLNNSSSDNLFILNTCNVILATREYDLLLGQLLMDGTRKPGVIDKFNVDVIKIIENVAHESEVKGLLNDAVRLYDLASNQVKVIEISIKLLGQVLSNSGPSNLNKENIKKIVISVADRYSKQHMGSKVNQSSMATFHLLLDISSFFDCYNANKYEEAYSIITDLDFIPFTEKLVEDKVKDFCLLSDEVRKCLPDVLLSTMSILLFFCKKIEPREKGCNHGVFSNLVAMESSKINLLKKYKSEAHALVSFSGSLPYRMPADTTARLVHMEASIK